MPESPLIQALACRSRVSAISTPGLVLVCAIAVPQFATAQFGVQRVADRAVSAEQQAPSGIVVVISEGVLALEEGQSASPPLVRLAASGVRFSDVVSPSPCATESLRSLETSRWTRQRHVAAEGDRLAELFAAAGWSVDELTGDDPPAVGAALSDRLDGQDNDPFLVLVKVPASGPAEARADSADPYLAQVERVLAERRLTADTLVVFVGTHGIDSPGGLRGTCSTLSAAALSVPLIMSWPAGWPGGSIVDSTVSLIDLLPTLIDVAQMGALSGAEGQSLVPLVLAPRAPSSLGYQRRPAFAYLAGAVDSAAVVDGGWKLIRRLGADGEITHALYDHVSDRADADDVAARYPDLAQRLIGRLDQWLGGTSSERGSDVQKLTNRARVS